MTQLLVTEGAAGNIPLARSDGGAILAVPISAAQLAFLLSGSLARAFTPNAEQSFGPITPGGAAFIIAVADVTPQVTGLMQVTATVAVSSSAPDAVNLALFAVAPLVSITGGTPVGQGITENPSATNPAFGGTPIMSVVGVESTAGGDLASVTVTGTFKATAGVRTGFVLTGLSAVGGATTWVVGFTMSAIEV